MTYDFDEDIITSYKKGKKAKSRWKRQGRPNVSEENAINNRIVFALTKEELRDFELIRRIEEKDDVAASRYARDEIVMPFIEQKAYFETIIIIGMSELGQKFADMSEDWCINQFGYDIDKEKKKEYDGGTIFFWDYGLNDKIEENTVVVFTVDDAEKQRVLKKIKPRFEKDTVIVDLKLENGVVKAISEDDSYKTKALIGRIWAEATRKLINTSL